MQIFEAMAQEGHEQVTFFYDRATGLKLIVAVHDTTLGPAAGGCRLWHYDAEDDAIADALRLSRGMTLKNAVAGLDFGGSKCVVYGDPEKTPELLRGIGRFIETMGGRVNTGEDVGLTPEDVEVMAETTRFIVGRKHKSGDPSKPAAYGTYMAVRAVLKETCGTPDPKGRRIVVQGAGNVGHELCRLLAADGADLVISDIRPDRAKEVGELYGARVVAPEAVTKEPGDVFSPCALGLVLTPEVARTIPVKAIAGSANNQLSDALVPAILKERGVLYAPDFVVNGGGIINISEEFHAEGYDKERAYAKVARIYDRLLEIFEVARREDITSEQAAEHLALQRIEREGAQNGMFIPREARG